jgi:hypothetical protein
VKAAETLRLRVRVSVQVGVVPLQFPPHALKTEPVRGAAVKVILVFAGKTNTQEGVLQVSPFAETVPSPVMVTARVRVVPVNPPVASMTAPAMSPESDESDESALLRYARVLV